MIWLLGFVLLISGFLVWCKKSIYHIIISNNIKQTNISLSKTIINYRGESDYRLPIHSVDYFDPKYVIKFYPSTNYKYNHNKIPVDEAIRKYKLWNVPSGVVYLEECIGETIQKPYMYYRNGVNYLSDDVNYLAQIIADLECPQDDNLSILSFFIQSIGTILVLFIIYI